LYLQYAQSKSDEILENLVGACDKIINVILATRYHRHFRHHDDLRQEIRLKLWKNLGRRTEESLRSERYTKNPTAYLFFLIRAHASKAFNRFKTIYKENKESSFEELEKRGSEMSDTEE
ncbi:unnamed protein product, partial [marine sediment metagenome]